MKAFAMPPVETLETHERKHRVVLSQELVHRILAQHFANVLGVAGDHWSYAVAPEGTVPMPVGYSLPQAPQANSVLVITEDILKMPRVEEHRG